MIIAAGGSGSRFSKNLNKLLIEYKNKPLIVHTLLNFLPVIAPGALVVAAPENLLEVMRKVVDDFLPGNHVVWTIGGASRIASIANAFELLPTELETVAIHDAARPLASAELLRKLHSEAKIFGGAVPGSALVDTVKKVDENGLIKDSLIRKELAAVYTPQVFDYQKYKFALNTLDPAVRNGLSEDPLLTDDAALFTCCGFETKVLFSSEPNPKITVISDLEKIQS